MYYRTKRESNITLTHVLLLLICAAAMNVINRYYYFIFLAVGLFFVKPKRRLQIDPLPMLMLFLLALSWLMFSPESLVSVFSPLKSFTYLLCYVMGVSLLDDDVDNSAKKNSYKLFYSVLVAAGAGMLIHYVLNWIININSIERNTVDFWTQTVIAATGQAALACIPLGIAVAVIFSKRDRRTKILAWATLVVVLGYNLILSGRTLILMLLVVAAVALIYRLSMQKSDRSKVMIVVVFTILALVFVYEINFLGIRSMIEGSPLYERFFAESSTTDLDEDGRMDKKIYYLQNMNRFLWGGAHLRDEKGHAHDLFLDTYDEAGIFAFVAIIVYVISSISHLVKFIKRKNIPFELRITVLCVYSALYIEFMIEPILQGMPWLFATFCLIDGYVYRILKQDRLSRNKLKI